MNLTSTHLRFSFFPDFFFSSFLDIVRSIWIAGHTYTDRLLAHVAFGLSLY